MEAVEGIRIALGGPEDDLVGVPEVLDGSPLALEFRIDADVEVLAGRLARCLLEERREFLLGRPGDDRALDHDRMLVRGAGKHLADCAGAGPHRVQVDVAVGVVVGREGKQREVGLADVRVVGRRAQAVAAMYRDEVVEARLVDRCFAGVDDCDDRLVDVHVDDRVARVGETGRDRRADVAAPDDADVHCREGGGRCS